ncbi:MAG TPA: sulfite exporter TauE/SafE family protein [Pyrinomonadaceae bacterium]|nr:sulfite exporter TauE/SafE family protein [Pyrinomonadaceae bacterium]
MPLSNLVLLVIAFFATSIIGVVTGSNSLITVPLMFQFGIDEKVAIATNMFGLTFMAVGGTIPFVRQGAIDFRSLSPLVIVTVIGSAIGAALVGLITNGAIKIIVIVAMVAVVLFTLLRRDRVATETKDTVRVPARLRHLRLVALISAFLLAIYGGLYSGGYVTVLTAALVAFSGMTFGESVAATKFINVFSSGIATLVFMWQGLVDYKLGIILAVAMFLGAFIGAHYATKLSEVWLRRVFISTVVLLALKTLLDFV